MHLAANSLISEQNFSVGKYVATTNLGCVRGWCVGSHYS